MNNTKSPLISIFIPVYNSEKYLSETLDSLLAQTFQDFEIVIADDGSTDGSLDIARSYEARDKRIKVLSSPHSGEVITRNEAIKYTNPNSKYLLNHDSDDISLPTKLEKLVKYLETYSEIAIVGCFAEYFDDEGNYKGQPSIEWKPERIRETFGELNSMVNSAALIRREVFKKIGLYREDMRGIDDYDFFSRALITGFNLANIPEVLHKIRLHPSSIGSKRQKEVQMLAEKVRMNYKQQTLQKHESRQPHKSLSILHTVEFYHPHIGGSEIVVQKISERLARRGHHVEVATTRLPERNFQPPFNSPLAKGGLRRVFELNKVLIHEFEIRGNLAFGFLANDVQRYQDFLLNHPAQVVMNYAAQQWATDLAFTVLESTRNKRVNVIAPCGYSALLDAKTLRWPQFSNYFNQILPQAIPLYDAAIYHSSLYKDYEFAQLHGFQNSVVIPNGVDEDEFSKPPALDFREKYRITTPYMGLCVANFYPEKGHDRVIEAVRQMKRKDFTMVFIGKDGEELSSLQKQAEGLDIKFLLNIPREDTVAAYHAADIFLFGSYIEASPLVIIEAKASRTPFVSTDCGNVREWKGGIVCTPDEMANNANKILDDESLRKQLAEEGYQEWKEKLTWGAIVDQYEDLYLRLYFTKMKDKSKVSHQQADEEFHLQESLEKDFRDTSALIRLAELELQRFNQKKARNYLIAALAIDPQNPQAKTLAKKLQN